MPDYNIETFESLHWYQHQWQQSYIWSYIQPPDYLQNWDNDYSIWVTQPQSTSEANIIESISYCDLPYGSDCSSLNTQDSCLKCECTWTIQGECTGITNTINMDEYGIFWNNGCIIPTWNQFQCHSNSNLQDIAFHLSRHNHNNNDHSIMLDGNTWIVQQLDNPIELTPETVWELESFLLHEGELQGFGITTFDEHLMVDKTLKYILWGRQGIYEASSYEWMYQGIFPWHQWVNFKLPLGDDWLRKYGETNIQIDGLIYFNDNDNIEDNVPQGSVGKILFDNIKDYTNYIVPDPNILTIDYIIVNEAVNADALEIKYTLTIDITSVDDNNIPIRSDIRILMSNGIDDIIGIREFEEVLSTKLMDGINEVIITKEYNEYLIDNLVKEKIKPMFIVEQSPSTRDTIIRKGWNSVDVDLSHIYEHINSNRDDLRINWVGDAMFTRRFECLEYECLEETFPNPNYWGGAWECTIDYPWTCPVECGSPAELGQDQHQDNLVCKYNTPSGIVEGDICISADECYQHLVCLEWNEDNCLVPGLLADHPPEYLGQEVSEYFPEDELNIVNLETVVSNIGEEYRHPRKSMVVKSPPETLSALTSLNFQVVSLANNHTTDYGEVGVLDTHTHLNMNNIRYSGDGLNMYEAYQPLFINRNQTLISLIAVCDRHGQYNGSWGIPTLSAGYYNKAGFANAHNYDVEKTINSVINMSDLVIVESHWGDEYVHFTPYNYRHGGEVSEDDRSLNTHYTNKYLQIMETENIMLDEDENYNVYNNMGGGYRTQSIHHSYIDMGAHMVIAHHPHVLNGIEWYNGGLIAHSLGNFIFDQNFPETMFSIILHTTLDEDNNLNEVKITPIILDRYRPKRAYGELGRRILENLANKSRLMNSYIDIYPDISIDKVHTGEPYAIVKQTNNPSDYKLINCQFDADDTFSSLSWLNENDHLNSWYDNSDQTPWFLSYSLRFPNNGSLNNIYDIDLTTNENRTQVQKWMVYEKLRFRLGKSLLWFGNMEDEGSTMWDSKHPNYDDFQFSSDSYVNDILSNDGYGTWSIQQFRTSENEEALLTSTKGRYVGRLIAEDTYNNQSFGNTSSPFFTLRGNYLSYFSGGIQAQIKCYAARSGSSLFTYTVFDEPFVPHDSTGSEWIYFEKNFALDAQCNFISVNLKSWPMIMPDGSIQYSYVYWDNIDVIQWEEEWYSLDNFSGVEAWNTPNDYHYMQFGMNNLNTDMFEGGVPQFRIDKLKFREKMYHDPDIDHREWIESTQNCNVIDMPNYIQNQPVEPG